MALTYRGVSGTGAPGSSTLSTTTANAQVGDLLVIFSGSYSSAFTAVTGGAGGTWNTLTTVTGTPGSDSNRTYVTVFWKIAVAGDIGSNFALSNGQPSYSGAYLIAIGGADPIDPFGASQSATVGSGSVNTGSASFTTTKVSRRFLFFSNMAASGGAVSSWSPTPTGYTKPSRYTGQSGWHSVQLYTANADSSPGTYAIESNTPSQSGSTIGFSANIQEYIPSVPTGVTVTNTPVPNGTIPTVSWTAPGQTSYRMRWR